MVFNRDAYIEMLAPLSNAIGVSGHEDAVANILIAAFKKQNLDIQRDGLGGVYASNIDFSQPTTKKRILIAAHMDEVGFIIKQILPNGLVKVHNVGGISWENLAGTRVQLQNKGKKIGVFTAVPSHFKTATPINSDSLFVDFGFENEEVARVLGATEGAIIGFDADFIPLANQNRFMGKAFDNRYACAMLAILSSTIYKENTLNPDVEVVLCATVMEEIGLVGASAAMDLVKPDMVIVLDCSPASDTLEKNNQNGVLGKGVLFRYLDARMIMNERVKRYFLLILDKYGVQYQPYISAGGTDAGQMVQLQGGTPTFTCCVPARYIHNHSGIIDIRDIEQAFYATFALVLNYDRNIHNYLNYLNEEKI